MVIVEGKNNTSSRCSGSGNSKLLSIMILRFVYFSDGTEKKLYSLDGISKTTCEWLLGPSCTCTKTKLIVPVFLQRETLITSVQKY